MSMRKFVIGDIHGGYRSLMQCLERSNFNKEEDLLITLGDIVDGWPETPQVVDELLTIKNRIDIRGNHDQWAVDWYLTGIAKHLWLSQGGQATFDAYIKMMDEDMDKYHYHFSEFFNKQDYYYIDDENRLFVHGGCDWRKPIEEQRMDDLMWDRHLYEVSLYHYQQNILHGENNNFDRYKEIYIGHTSTLSNQGFNWRIEPFTEPRATTNVWNLDQGGGWGGKLSIMNIDTKEFWQSDNVKNLYNDYIGRK